MKSALAAFLRAPCFVVVAVAAGCGDTALSGGRAEFDGGPENGGIDGASGSPVLRSDTSQDSVPQAAPGETLSHYCLDGGVSALCSKLVTCHWLSPQQLAACVSQEQASCTHHLGNVDAGYATYDGQSIAACSAAVQAASCGEIEDLFLGSGACPRVLTYSGGLRLPDLPGSFLLRPKIGQSCSQFYPCAEGYCAGDRRGCGVCTELSHLGQPCSTGTACDPATTCRQGTCVTRPAPGAPCASGEACAWGYCLPARNTCPPLPAVVGNACNAAQACAPPAFCLMDRGAATGTCTAPSTAGQPCPEGHCAAPLVCFGGRCMIEPFHAQGLGQTCLQDSDCVDNSYCGNGTCKAALPAGSGCAPGRDKQCQVGAFCSWNNGNYTCVVPVGPDQKCSGNEDYGCQIGLRCLGPDRTCVPGAALGERCDTLYGFCAQGFCPFAAKGPRTCSDYLPLAAPCQGDYECASGFCDTTLRCAQPSTICP